MNNEINERLVAMIKAIGITQKRFCETLGIPIGTLNSMFQRGSSPGPEMLKSIAEKFPDYSINWLLTGNGDVIVNSENKISDVSNGSVLLGNKIEKIEHSFTHEHTDTDTADAIKDTLIGYREALKTYQDHTDKLLIIIEKLSEKHEK